MLQAAPALHVSTGPLPHLIQGGMGVGVSTWRLARSVAQAGHALKVPVLGVVSGTGLPMLLADRLHRGDADAARAVRAFDADAARSLEAEYGRPRGRGLRSLLAPKPEVLATGSDGAKAKMALLSVAAAFAEVWLAKEGHDGPIGLNLLEKIQLMHLPTLLGAMLAGVDYVLVGAGIPHQIPAVLDSFARRKAASYRLDVAGSQEKFPLTLDPAPFLANHPRITRPRFLAIVSHHVLAMRLASTVDVDGFVVEGPLAGGHNAPARGKTMGADGQPIYGERDCPDLEKIRDTGKPFWLAGSFGAPGRLADAQRAGAVGIQVGSAFALSNESGLSEPTKRRLREGIAAGDLEVRTSATASPSGFPFQVAQLEETLSDPAVYRARDRICNLGHLVEAYRDDTRPTGIGFRCPAEPTAAFLRKGGTAAQAEGRLCLCNGLAAAAGHGRETADGPERAVVTLGKDHSFYGGVERSPDGSYGAIDVVRSVFGLSGGTETDASPTRTTAETGA